MKRVAAGGVVVGLLTVAITAVVLVATRSPERALTAAELAWVRTFVDWRDDRWRSVAVVYDELGGVPEQERSTRLSAELGTCTRSLERAVGPAPGALGSLRAAAGDACAAMEEAAELLSGPGSSRSDEARGALLDADQAFVRTDSWLDRRLLLRRALPAVEGPAPESRVDPRLSEAATAASGIPMSVRCWSRSDWPRARAELRSLVVRERSEEVESAGAWDGEPSLSPQVCAALAPILAGEQVGRATARLVRGLVVLGHEIAHASGVVDEEQAGCDGIRLVGELATHLGVSGEVADDLAAGAWTRHQPERARLPACRAEPSRLGEP